MVQVLPSSLQPTKASSGSKLGLLWRWLRYLTLGGVANSLIWAMAIYYLRTAETIYASEMLINLPGSGPGISVNLPEIGQASASSGSAFGSSTSDPRETLKLIATSSTVQKAAAKALDIDSSSLGKPRIKILDNTTGFTMEVRASTAEEAQARLEKVYQVFLGRLKELRGIEAAERDQTAQESLEQAQKNLQQAQERLSSYKVSSGLSSSDQLSDLATTIEQIRRQQIEVDAQREQMKGEYTQLSESLDMTPETSSEMLVLQGDPVFQASFQGYKETSVKLEGLLTYRGPNYPDVVRTQKEKEAALNLVLQQAGSLLKRPILETELTQLVLDPTTGREQAGLLSELIRLQSQQQGLDQRSVSLAQQRQSLEKLMTQLTIKESTFETLERDLQIAEAVFASTLAKADLGKGDSFVSYPLVQVLEAPSLPAEAIAPKPKLILLGGVMGSVMTSAGLTLLWWRQPLLALTVRLIRGLLA